MLNVVLTAVKLGHSQKLAQRMRLRAENGVPNPLKNGLNGKSKLWQNHTIRGNKKAGKAGFQIYINL